ncbi:hypothetical protein G5V59_18200 [Nocardioides sp. W3-2-3]|nr:hypothetical protein [Nocardioides convexus]
MADGETSGEALLEAAAQRDPARAALFLTLLTALTRDPRWAVAPFERVVPDQAQVTQAQRQVWLAVADGRIAPAEPALVAALTRQVDADDGAAERVGEWLRGQVPAGTGSLDSERAVAQPAGAAAVARGREAARRRARRDVCRDVRGPPGRLPALARRRGLARRGRHPRADGRRARRSRLPRRACRRPGRDLVHAHRRRARPAARGPGRAGRLRPPPAGPPGPVPPARYDGRPARHRGRHQPRTHPGRDRARADHRRPGRGCGAGLASRRARRGRTAHATAAAPAAGGYRRAGRRRGGDRARVRRERVRRAGRRRAARGRGGGGHRPDPGPAPARRAGVRGALG